MVGPTASAVSESSSVSGFRKSEPAATPTTSILPTA
jgi:hypothetical protein